MLPAHLQSLASADMEDLGLHSCASPGPCKEASNGPEFPGFLRQYVEVGWLGAVLHGPAQGTVGSSMWR